MTYEEYFDNCIITGISFENIIKESKKDFEDYIPADNFHSCLLDLLEQTNNIVDSEEKQERRLYLFELDKKTQLIHITNAEENMSDLKLATYWHLEYQTIIEELEPNYFDELEQSTTNSSIENTPLHSRSATPESTSSTESQNQEYINIPVPEETLQNMPNMSHNQPDDPSSWLTKAVCISVALIVMGCVIYQYYKYKKEAKVTNNDDNDSLHSVYEDYIFFEDFFPKLLSIFIPYWLYIFYIFRYYYYFKFVKPSKK